MHIQGSPGTPSIFFQPTQQNACASRKKNMTDLNYRAKRNLPTTEYSVYENYLDPDFGNQVILSVRFTHYRKSEKRKFAGWRT